MAGSINPTPGNIGATASYPKGPTDVNFMLQDPTVDHPVDTIKLNLQGTAKPTSEDYTLSVAVKPDKDGAYKFDPKDVKNFLPMTILANAQRGFDTFIKYCDNVPATWATGQKQLVIHPDDGVDFNAYYNREAYQGVEPGTHFFHDTDPKTKQVLYSGMSGEVTSHEGGPGHALLDRFRPNYFSTFSPDPAAFHESFGDVSAMLVQLTDPKIVAKVAAQTGGDFSKHSIISDTGEQLGTGINDYVESQGGPKNYTGGPFVRTMINDLKWVDPNTLDSDPNADPEHLSTEPHDWSRLWTGAVYETLGKMVSTNMAGGQDAAAAITSANEDLLKIYGKLISVTSPEGDFTYKDMANSLVKADELTGGKWGSVIKDVFTDRRILPASAGLVDEPVQTLSGSHKVTSTFTSNEKAFEGTQLANLGNFTVSTVQSGNQMGFTAEDHSAVDAKLQKDLANLAKQGKILFTAPGQSPNIKKATDLINPATKEPYVGVVEWGTDGQANIRRLAIAG